MFQNSNGEASFDVIYIDEGTLKNSWPINAHEYGIKRIDIEVILFINFYHTVVSLIFQVPLLTYKGRVERLTNLESVRTLIKAFPIFKLSSGCEL